MSYLFEPHFHTPLTSHCGEVHPDEAIPTYIEKGYAGAFITDHYYKEWFYESRFAAFSWEEKVAVWLDGYHAAQKAAEHTDFQVILGMELRFTGSMNDYLVFGIDERFLCGYPELYNLTPSAFKALADAHGLFIAQAHPFRSMCSPQDPKNLHGVEVFNGNGRHSSNNETAMQFARDNHLVMLSGSDFHQWEDLGTGGIYLDRIPGDSKELAAMLLRNEIAGLK